MKRHNLFGTILTFLFFITTHQGLTQQTAILCKTLIDGNGKSLTNAVIIVEGEKIISIGKKENIPSGAAIIDLSGYTILPGMIDVHVHPLIDGDDYQVNHLRTSSAAKALNGLRRVQGWLSSGWTTLRIAGDADVAYAHLEIRNAINNGMFVGPRIYGAGHYISVTGGGGDVNFFSPEQKVIADGLVVDGPAEIQKAVRTEIKYGSDWIKLLVTGAFMTVGDDPQNVHFSQEELNAAVEEAARRNVPVMAHAHAVKGIKMAINAGAKSIEHGTFIDEEAMQMMIKQGTYLVPTLSMNVLFLEEYESSKALEKAVELTKRYKTESDQNYRKAIKLG